MSQPPNSKRALSSGVWFAQFHRTRRLAADLVAQGQHARDRLATAIDQFVAMGRHGNESLARIVRSGVDRPLSGLGLVTAQDLAAFERRMRAAHGAPAKKKVAAKRDRPKKSAAASTAP
jgi:hypothetical protein